MFSKLHLQGRLLDLIVKFISAARQFGYYLLINWKVSFFLARKKYWEVHLGMWFIQVTVIIFLSDSRERFGQILVIRFYLDVAFSCSGEQLHWCLCNKTPNTLFITSSVGHTPWYLVMSQCALRVGSYSASASSYSYQCSGARVKPIARSHWISHWRMWVILLLESRIEYYNIFK